MLDLLRYIVSWTLLLVKVWEFHESRCHTSLIERLELQIWFISWVSSCHINLVELTLLEFLRASSISYCGVVTSPLPSEFCLQGWVNTVTVGWFSSLLVLRDYFGFNYFLWRHVSLWHFIDFVIKYVISTPLLSMWRFKPWIYRYVLIYTIDHVISVSSRCFITIEHCFLRLYVHLWKPFYLILFLPLHLDILFVYFSMESFKIHSNWTFLSKHVFASWLSQIVCIFHINELTHAWICHIAFLIDT